MMVVLSDRAIAQEGCGSQEEFTQAEEVGNGFATVLNCCIACPSIPRNVGLSTCKDYRSAWLKHHGARGQKYRLGPGARPR